jgi:protein SCO1/2
VTRLLALCAALALLAGCSSAAGGHQPSELNDKTASTLYSGFGLVPPQPRPAFTLTDTAAHSYAFGTRTAERPTLLYFGYTRCPDVCPTTMLDIRTGLLAVPAVLRAKVQVVFVTTDVKHDTGPVIHSWLSKFDAGLPNPFVGLYGTQAQVDIAQAAAHVQLAEDDGQQHAANVLLYGSDDYARVQYLQSTSEADQIAHDLPLVDKTP